ncbi:MAG: hypothetical protein ACRDWD_10300 [Acidimicrobiia bacterium]
MRETVLRIGVWFLGLSALLTGAWAALTPRSFYDDFPGFGRTWIAPDGPYNEHLVRDVGELYLALAVVTIAAAVTLSRPLVRSVLLAWMLSGVLHTVYHARHTDPFDAADAVAIVGSLVLQPVLAAVLLYLTYPARDRAALSTER